MQKNKNFFKRPTSKVIIFEKPKDRYLIDLTEIPFEISKDLNYKFICNIIDHFSKMCKSYLINNKKALNILFCIEDFVKIYGKPLSFGSDNGREFKNKLINDYMKENGINFIHGLPYKPHSQGVVERIHKTIKTALIIKKLESKDSFNLSEKLNEVVSVYNNTIHSVLKATPNEVFFSTNTKFLKKIKNNIKNYYYKNDHYIHEVDLDDKVLIANNIIVKELKKEKIKILELNKIKKDNKIYEITGEVLNIHGSGIFDILISKDYKEFKLLKNDICRVPRELFKIISMESWEELRNKL